MCCFIPFPLCNAVMPSTPIGEPGRIHSPAGEVANSFQVKYSSIDVNSHANSLLCYLAVGLLPPISIGTTTFVGLK